MARKRTLVIVSAAPAPPGGGGGGGGGMGPLGTLREVLGAMGRCNIAPDGSGPQGWGNSAGMAVLHGPGMVFEVPVGSGDPKADVLQAMCTVTDEDFAFPVLMRLCKEWKWRMMDPDTGRTFG